MVQEGQCTDSCWVAAFSAQQQAYAAALKPPQLVGGWSSLDRNLRSTISFNLKERVFQKTFKGLYFRSVCSFLFIFPAICNKTAHGKKMVPTFFTAGLRLKLKQKHYTCVDVSTQRDLPKTEVPVQKSWCCSHS